MVWVSVTRVVSQSDHGTMEDGGLLMNNISFNGGESSSKLVKQRKINREIKRQGMNVLDTFFQQQLPLQLLLFTFLLP
jgi:hypothetical protein